MRPKSFASSVCGGLFACLLACAPAACPGPIVASCEDYEVAFQEVVDSRGILNNNVPDVPPFPMAIAFSEPAVNELLGSAIGEGADGVPDLSVVEQIGPLLVNFQPLEDPEITLEHHAGCETCIRIFTKYNVDVSFDDEGIINGIGDFTVAVPVYLLQQNTTSHLVANFDQLVMENDDFHMTLSGIDLDDYTAVKDFLQNFVEREMRAGFGETNLIEMSPWTIGSENVVMAARKVVINNDARTLVVGAATNLQIPTDAGIELESLDLTDSKSMSVVMHTELIEKMSQRMIVEGEIARSYDDNGMPDENGKTSVTLDAMATGASDPGRIRSRFTVWRTDDKYCGFAVVDMPLALEIENSVLGVRPGDIKVIEGEGVGELAVDNDEFVQENEDLVATFKNDLAEQVGITVNYQEFKLPNSVLVFESEDVTTTDIGVEVSLDFTIVSGG